MVAELTDVEIHARQSQSAPWVSLHKYSYLARMIFFNLDLDIEFSKECETRALWKLLTKGCLM